MESEYPGLNSNCSLNAGPGTIHKYFGHHLCMGKIEMASLRLLDDDVGERDVCGSGVKNMGH